MMNDTNVSTNKTPTNYASVGNSSVCLSAEYKGKVIESRVACTSPVEGMMNALLMMPLDGLVGVTVYKPTQSRNGMTRARVMLDYGNASYPGFAKHEDPSAAIAEAGLTALLCAISSQQAAQHVV